MTILVVGATGATGILLVKQLLALAHNVKVIVRIESKIPPAWNNAENISVIKANIAEIDTETLMLHLDGCQAVVSCLGHNLTWGGIFGKPRNLVTHSVAIMCDAIIKRQPGDFIKFILMNTAGNRNRDLNEPISMAERLVIGLLRMLLPPHPDNEMAADYLRVKVGQHNAYIKWVVIRPDTLINEENVSMYTIHRSPTRSAIFNSGKTSRVNVANLMSRLITDQNVWKLWEGQMPVIYNDNE